MRATFCSGDDRPKKYAFLAWGLSFLIYINLLLKAYILCCGIFRSEARAGRF